MPSTRGWAALGTATALALLWVAFGERELIALGLLLAIGTLAGIVAVRITVPRVEVNRRVSPVQVHEGERAIVELTITTSQTLRNVIVEDTVTRLGSARFAAGRIQPGTPLEARYEVVCRPRGLYTIGPATVSSGDPLGLAQAGGEVGTLDRLIVYPGVEDLEGYPVVRGRDPSVQSSRPTQSPHGGEDFFTLREYEVGDDLRRVHWPSSAKRDRLMIRQLEIPWQSRALILLDRRLTAYDSGDGFEHAVRGAASVLRHLHRGGFSPELWTGENVGRSPMVDRYTHAMGVLAEVQRARLDLGAAVSRLRAGSLGGGALIIITGEPDESVATAYRHLSRAYARSLILAVTAESHPALSMYRRGGAVTVAADPRGDWTTAWNQAMERAWSTAIPG